MTDRPRHSARVPRPVDPQPTMAELAGRLERGMGDLSGQIRDSVSACELRLSDRIGAVHMDVALLRKTVLADHAPRLTAVEQRTPAQRMGSAALCAGKWSVYATALAVGLRVLAKAFPTYGDAIEGVLQSLGL